MQKLETKDGEQISFKHYKNKQSHIIIIAHGFYNNKDTILFRQIAEVFSAQYDVITFDFRGHGKSSGLFTWTSKEAEDLRVIIEYAKGKKYEKIGVIGFSLGAAIALIEGSQNKDIDSLIAVSAPFDFWKINYRFWEEEMMNDLKLNIGPKGKGKGIRPGNPFEKKVRPLDIVGKITPIPVLFLHGKKDWLIASTHSDKLFKKAKEPKKLKILKEAGHAEKIFDNFPKEFKKICLEWFQQTLKK